MRRILTTVLMLAVAFNAAPAFSQEWNIESNQQEIRRLQQQNRVINAERNAARAQFEYDSRYNSGGGYNPGYSNNGYYNPPQIYHGNNGGNGSAALAGAVVGLALGAFAKGAMSQPRSQQPTRFDPDSNEDSVLIGRVGQERKYRHEPGCRLADAKFQSHRKYDIGSCGNTPYYFSKADGSKIRPIPGAN
ncbi:MAG: hypothetical protein EON60_07580 [Alphaproteobacteria bacterium]|nr:MAG: hypothetical protein EON60_07580 [Alphaproteobacteria bacterium]